MSRGVAPFGYMLPDVCYLRVLSPCVKPNHFFFGLIQVTGCSTLGQRVSIGLFLVIPSFCVLFVPAPFVSFLAIMSVSEEVHQWVAEFWNSIDEFQIECAMSLGRCGDYSEADLCNFPPVPILLFEKDALFDEIISVFEGGTENDLLSSFQPYIAAQEELYAEAVHLHEGLAPDSRSTAASFHGLFPFHLAVTGPSGPHPLVRIKALLDAYAWIHSPVLVRQATRVQSVPNLFLTSGCIALYDFVLRGKIGDWLVKHKDYWCGIAHSTTGVRFPLGYTDPYTRPCTVDEIDFRTRYITEDYGILEEERAESIRDCGDYTQAVFPYRCVPSFLFGDGELFGDPSGESDSAIALNNHFLAQFSQSWIDGQMALYAEAKKLHDDLPPHRQSKAAPLHDLFPFRLAITGPSGPWPLAHIRGLLEAYNWVHSPRLQQCSRNRGDVPTIFIAPCQNYIYDVYLRARIGEWLVNHQAYWLGLEFTATGLAPTIGGDELSDISDLTATAAVLDPFI